MTLISNSNEKKMLVPTTQGFLRVREISKAKQIDVHHFTRRIRQIEEIGNRNIARSEAISASVRF